MAQENQTQDTNINSIFGLTTDQTWLLYCCQYSIIFSQYYVEENVDKKERKRIWMEKWLRTTSDTLSNEFNCADAITLSQSYLSKKCAGIQQSTHSTAWKYLILLESVVFHPFFPLGTEEDDKKLVKGLKMDKEQTRKTLENITKILGIDPSYIEKFSKSHKNAIKRLSGDRTWKIIAVGAAVAALSALGIVFFQPQIILLLAPTLAPGLSGAAATSAVLAALGGGSIAAGGLGMAGGVAVLVGGGVLLGGGAGTGAAMAIFKQSSSYTLSQAAKIEVVLKEIVLGIQNDVKMFQTILLKQQEQIAAMRAELLRLNEESTKHKNEIKNLKKSIEYLERLCKIQ